MIYRRNAGRVKAPAQSEDPLGIQETRLTLLFGPCRHRHQRFTATAMAWYVLFAGEQKKSVNDIDSGHLMTCVEVASDCFLGICSLQFLRGVPRHGPDQVSDDTTAVASFSHWPPQRMTVSRSRQCTHKSNIAQ